MLDAVGDDVVQNHHGSLFQSTPACPKKSGSGRHQRGQEDSYPPLRSATGASKVAFCCAQRRLTAAANTEQSGGKACSCQCRE